MFAQLRGVDPVEVIEKWTVRLESGIEILTRPPRQFAAYAEIVLQKQVDADDWIRAAGE